MRQALASGRTHTSPKRPQRHFIGRVLLGLAVITGCGGLAVYAPFWLLLPVLGLIAAGVALEWHARQLIPSTPDIDHHDAVDTSDVEPVSEEENGRTALTALGRDLLPVWRRHIESVRTQSEEAIVALTQQFTGMNAELRSAVEVFESLDVDQSGLGAVLVRSHERLTEVVDRLQQTLDQQERQLRDIESLGGYIHELDEMAAQVAVVASRTNLL